MRPQSKFRMVLMGVLFLLTACADSPSPMAPHAGDPAEPAITGSSALATSTSSDSVQWVNNVLEATDGYGNVMRYERSGPEGAWDRVRISENGVHKVTLSIQYSGSTISADELYDVDSAQWMDRNPDGDISNTSTGTLGGGAGGGDELLGVGKGGPGTRVGIMGHSTCESEWNNMQNASWDAAMAAGLGAIITASSATMLYGPAVYNAAWQTLEAGISLGHWAYCRLV
jgi:hypothetical protein